MANMQWQSLAESKIKDRAENRECRALRGASKNFGTIRRTVNEALDMFRISEHNTFNDLRLA